MKPLDVLHVEDNAGDALILEDLLNEIAGFNFNISLAGSLREAMEFIDRELYDIIVLDLGLPDSIELQALEIILQKTDSAPVLVLTGMNDDQLGRKAIKMGAQSYIPKNEINERILLQSILYSMERHEHLKKIRKTEEELKQKNALLEEASKSKDKLLSIITHDLRSPMSSVVGLLTMLSNEYDEFGEKQRKEYLRICQENTSTTFQLIETVLAWAQSQTNKRSVSAIHCNVSELVQSSIEPLQSVAKAKNIIMENSVPGNIEFYADPDMMKTVVRNLVSNAIKFSYKGSTVEIGIMGDQSDAAIKLYVKDKGVGISGKDQEKILDIQTGYTTPGTDNEKGTGFGLILCQEFVEKNGGELRIESEHDKGTTVSFSVPTNPNQ